MKLKLGRWNVLLGACILGLLLAVGAGNALATPYSTSTSIVEWSSLSITHSADGSFIVSDEWSETDAEAENEAEFLDAYDDGVGWEETDAFAKVANASGHGWAKEYEVVDDKGDPVVVKEIGETVVASADGIANIWALASADAFHEAMIVVDNPGTITIEIGYKMSQFLSTDSLTEIAFGAALADLYFVNDDSEEDYYDYFEIANFVIGTDEFDSGIIEGTLSASLYFTAGQVGFFNSFVINDAGAGSVPEPATMLLLGSGLLGIVGFRRKQKR